jgi:hypothetical protein
MTGSGTRVGDDQVRDLARRGVDEVRARLRQHRPEPGDGRASLWWETLVVRALHVVYHSGSPARRRDDARLVVTATEEAVGQGVTRPIDAAIPRSVKCLPFAISKRSRGHSAIRCP